VCIRCTAMQHNNQKAPEGGGDDRSRFRGFLVIMLHRKGAAVIAASMHGFDNCPKFKSPVTLILTLDRVKVISSCTIPVYQRAQPIHLTVASRTTEIWSFEFREISTFREL